MSKHQITGYVYRINYDWQEPHEFQVEFHPSKTMGKTDPSWVLVKQHSFDVEVPDDFDPRPAQVQALREKEQEMRAEFARNITNIQSQINSLLALEMA